MAFSAIVLEHPSLQGAEPGAQGYLRYLEAYDAHGM